jgi:hypothetical protein
MRDPRRQHTEKWKYLSKGINQYLHSRDASGFLYLLSNLTNPSNLILLKEVGAASISICWRELFTKWKKNCCRGTIDEDTLAAATGFAQSGWPCRSGLDRDKTSDLGNMWVHFMGSISHSITRKHKKPFAWISCFLKPTAYLRQTQSAIISAKASLGVSVDMTSHLYNMKSGIPG